MSFTKSPNWIALVKHQNWLSKINLRDLFNRDPNRSKEFSIELDDIFVDFSKHNIVPETLGLLSNFAEERNLKDKIESMFRGEKINFTENRPVLHIALRNRSNLPILVDGRDVMPDVNAVLSKMQQFVEKIHNGSWCGFSGERITDVVNIGIGGSDLGPRLVCEALQPYRNPNLNIHFVSNVDGSDIQRVLKKVKPKNTLFLISSKSFTTTETMTNAQTARNWFLENGSSNENYIAKNFVAISTNTAACRKFGIPPENMFEFWDWVGGRFSLWSAIGLSIALYIGWENFIALLEGANIIDNHFRSEDLERNIPAIMGLLSFWYTNFWGYHSWAVVPYEALLTRLPIYLQQMIMESNGKRINENGYEVDYQTGEVTFGGVGTDSQHAFFQLLHQGTQIIPVDFIGVCIPHHQYQNHHKILIANMIAQAEALMRGKNRDEVEVELKPLDETTKAKILPHKIFPGNRPSTTILLRRLTPKTLGMLLAIYEHRVFVQGAILGINSFDQWGVELGKELSRKILTNINSNIIDKSMSSSSQRLMAYFMNNFEKEI